MLNGARAPLCCMHTDFYNTQSELQQKNNKSWQGSQNKLYRPVIFVSEYTSSPGKIMLFLAFSLNVVEIPLYKRYIVRKSLLTTFHFNRFIAARKPSCIHFFHGKKKDSLSHSPLLEVKRMGSLLILKSSSSIIPRPEQARAQRLPGSGKNPHRHAVVFYASSFYLRLSFS